MKNLFVCHTQAQLILACGLSQGRYRNEDNRLVLFVDFGINDSLKTKLNKVFNRTLYLQSIYPAEYNTLGAKLKWYPKDWKLLKQFIIDPFDNVFVVCDWLLLVQKIIQRVLKINAKAKTNWLEDGITAYYCDSDNRTGLDSNRFGLSIRAFIFKYIFRIGDIYDRQFFETGGLDILRDIYCCYPEAVREPYKSKKNIIEISDEEYRLGLASMYEKTSLNIEENTCILVVDKLDRYKYPDKVKSVLAQFFNQCRESGKKVICKFHPRETEIWDVFNGYPQLEKSVGIESVYVSLNSIKESITIAGIKSTGLMSAKKLGYNTESLFLSCGEVNENLINFYEKLGVKLV